MPNKPFIKPSIHILAEGCQYLVYSDDLSAISDFYFRSQGLWSAEGKTIPRKRKSHDVELHDEFVEAFRALFEDAQREKVIVLAEKVLKPYGVFLFDGLKLEASKDWRSVRGKEIDEIKKIVAEEWQHRDCKGLGKAFGAGTHPKFSVLDLGLALVGKILRN